MRRYFVLLLAVFTIFFQACKSEDTPQNMLKEEIDPQSELTAYWAALYELKASGTGSIPSSPLGGFGNRVCEVLAEVENPEFSKIPTVDGENILIDVYGNTPLTKPGRDDEPIIGGKLLRDFDMMEAGLRNELWKAVIASKDGVNSVLFYPECVDLETCGEFYGYVYGTFNTARASFSIDMLKVILGLRWHDKRGTIDAEIKQDYVDLNPQVSQFEFDQYLDAVDAGLEKQALDRMQGYPYTDFTRGHWRKIKDGDKVRRVKFVSDEGGVIVYMLEFFDERFAQQYFGPHGLDVPLIAHFKDGTEGWTHIAALRGTHFALYQEFVDMNYDGTQLHSIKGLNIMCLVMRGRWGTFVFAPPGWKGGGWK